MDSRRNKPNVLEADPSTNYYIDEQDRFNKDFVVEDQRRREEERQRREAVRHKGLSDYLSREDARRKVEEDAAYREKARLESLQAKWTQGQKNSTGSAFNPISLDYDPTLQGEALRDADYRREMWADARKAHIDSKSNSAYNPLTGAPRGYDRR